MRILTRRLVQHVSLRVNSNVEMIGYISEKKNCLAQILRYATANFSFFLTSHSVNS